MRRPTYIETIKLFKKYRFAGKAFAEMINSSVDFKEGKLYAILLVSNLWTPKETSDVLIDLAHGYTKAGFKENLNTLGSRDFMRDYFIDCIAGKHK